MFYLHFLLRSLAFDDSQIGKVVPVLFEKRARDQNQLMGRAYLAQMYLRYGNWADAIAAYNWGRGNMDLWIAGGRDLEQLPLDVARYVARVMRDALITTGL